MLRRGIERNIAEPGPYVSVHSEGAEAGLFFDDYSNWRRIPEFEDSVRRSPAARLAGTFMDVASTRG